MTRRLRTKLLLSIPVFPVALLFWAFWLEPAGLKNEDHALALADWPAECDGIRIAILADLHLGSPFNGLAKLSDIVALTLRARPDLVLLAGDYVIHGVVGGQFVPPEEVAPVLARLRAPMGVYAVLGNHDWWFDAPRVRQALESAGIPVLEDVSTMIRKGACQLWLGRCQ
jgi:predicted MPP superfamily phosphohydrolase